MNKSLQTLDVAHKNLPFLDGLRAVSILLVVFSHAGLQHLIPGGLGVVVFFVISGFLITRLMLEEVAETGTLSIRMFYIRRFLRLMPTVLVFLILFVPILLALGAQISFSQVASVLLYFANYYHIYIEYPPHSAFPIFWSLSVEEHFYIVFPFLFYVLRKHLVALTAILGAAVLGVLLWRVNLFHLCLEGTAPYNVCGVQSEWSDRIFHGTDSIVDCILYGVLTSLLLTIYKEKFLNLVARSSVFYISLILMLISLAFRNDYFRETLRYTVQAISVSLLVINLLFGQAPRLRAFLELPVLVSVGRWSYALYIFHYAVFTVLSFAQPAGEELQFGWEAIFGLIVSFGTAGFVYNFIEKPIQKIRRRFHPIPNAGI